MSASEAIIPSGPKEYLVQSVTILNEFKGKCRAYEAHPKLQERRAVDDDKSAFFD